MSLLPIQELSMIDPSRGFPDSDNFGVTEAKVVRTSLEILVQYKGGESAELQVGSTFLLDREYGLPQLDLLLSLKTDSGEKRREHPFIINLKNVPFHDTGEVEIRLFRKESNRRSVAVWDPMSYTPK